MSPDWLELSLGAPTRAPVTAVSRSEDKLDIFVLSEDTVMTAGWELGTGWSDWKWVLLSG